MSRKIPWIVRVLVSAVLVPVALFIYGVGAFFEWLEGRVREKW